MLKSVGLDFDALTEVYVAGAFGRYHNVERSLGIGLLPDLPLERLKQLYGEMTLAFKPESLKRLEDVSDFHKRLLENRIARLSREKLNLTDQLKKAIVKMQGKQRELDQQLKALGQARALDQYTAIVNEIANLTMQAQKLRDYKTIDLEYSNREANLEGQLSDEVIKTNTYLEDTRETREKNFKIFKQ